MVPGWGVNSSQKVLHIYIYIYIYTHIDRSIANSILVDCRGPAAVILSGVLVVAVCQDLIPKNPCIQMVYTAAPK